MFGRPPPLGDGCDALGVPVEVGLGAGEEKEGVTVVVTTMGGPAEGVTVITTTLLLDTGSLLVVDVEVVLVRLPDVEGIRLEAELTGVVAVRTGPLDGEGSRDEFELMTGAMVLELYPGVSDNESEGLFKLELDAVGPGATVVVFKGIGKGADGY